MTPRAVVREGLTVGIAVGFYAVSFGAVSVAAGLSVLQTCAMSLLMFTGASQFAFVGVVASGGTPASATVTATLLGARNALYGLRLAPLLGFTGWRRTAAAHLVIDESTAMLMPGRRRRPCAPASCRPGSGSSSAGTPSTLVGPSPRRDRRPRDVGLDGDRRRRLAMLWPRLHGTVHRVTALLPSPSHSGSCRSLARGASPPRGAGRRRRRRLARPEVLDPPGDQPSEGQA